MGGQQLTQPGPKSLRLCIFFCGCRLCELIANQGITEHGQDRQSYCKSNLFSARRLPPESVLFFFKPNPDQLHDSGGDLGRFFVVG